jgi:hypothetical protein
MQPAVGAFWAAYQRVAGADVDPLFLHRCVSWVGVRLLQSVFERGAQQYELDRSSLLVLQLAINVLTRPLEAQVHLLGLDLGVA